MTATSRGPVLGLCGLKEKADTPRNLTVGDCETLSELPGFLPSHLLDIFAKPAFLPEFQAADLTLRPNHGTKSSQDRVSQED